MRVIAIKTLSEFWVNYPESEKGFRSWYREASGASWKSHQELKEQYRSASVLGDNRIVFNIAGNKFRLIVDIEFHLQIAFVVWLGTHSDYNKIDAKSIRYAKTNKK